jgi:hypothetical protein
MRLTGRDGNCPRALRHCKLRLNDQPQCHRVGTKHNPQKPCLRFRRMSLQGFFVHAHGRLWHITTFGCTQNSVEIGQSQHRSRADGNFGATGSAGFRTSPSNTDPKGGGAREHSKNIRRDLQGRPGSAGSINPLFRIAHIAMLGTHQIYRNRAWPR